MKLKNNLKNSVAFKRIASAAVALTMVTGIAALSGCSGKQESGADGKVEISVANWPAKEGALLDANNKIKETFEKENPDITIVPDTWTFDLQSFYPKAAAGLLPTVFTAFYSEITNLIDTGYLADITDYIKQEGYYDMINPTVRDIMSKDGKVYALPNESYGLGVAVNIKLLEQAGFVDADGTPHQPKDWTELAEMAKIIKEKTGKAGFVMQTAENYGGWIFTNIAWGFGTEFMKKENGKWKATFNSDEAAEALQYIKDLKWKYDVLPANVVIGANDVTELFATGQAAMMITGSGIGDSIGSYDMDKNDLGMLGMPAGPKGRYSLVGGMLTCISANSTEAQIKAALKWLSLDTYTDEQKASYSANQQQYIDKGAAVGIKTLPSWLDEKPSQKFIDEFREKNTNININHVKVYNDFLDDKDVIFRAEEPVCAQDLYGLLDDCVQSVIKDKNADCKALLEEANKNFQQQYLDKMETE